MNNPLKHKPKNYKRTTTTKLLSEEYCALDEKGQLKANFNTLNGLLKYVELSTEKLTMYKFTTYKINENIIKFKERKG